VVRAAKIRTGLGRSAFRRHGGSLPTWLSAWALLLWIGIVDAGLLVREKVDASYGTKYGVYTPVVPQVLRYLDEWDTLRDPLVTLPNGAQAKASNVYGIEVGGVRYYYQLTRGSSFDPLRLGRLSGYKTIATIDVGTPWEVLIYVEGNTNRADDHASAAKRD